MPSASCGGAVAGRQDVVARIPSTQTGGSRTRRPCEDAGCVGILVEKHVPAPRLLDHRRHPSRVETGAMERETLERSPMHVWITTCRAPGRTCGATSRSRRADAPSRGRATTPVSVHHRDRPVGNLHREVHDAPVRGLPGHDGRVHDRSRADCSWRCARRSSRRTPRSPNGRPRGVAAIEGGLPLAGVVGGRSAGRR